MPYIKVMERSVLTICDLVSEMKFNAVPPFLADFVKK